MQTVHPKKHEQWEAMKACPVMSVQWLPAADLNANDYNPNVVFTPELKLLAHSILQTGWVQPILITCEGIIIDGFHRRMLALEQPLLERYGGFVPCCLLDVSRAEAMLMTIRMNRAKGTHTALRMSAVVRELIDVHGVAPMHIAQGIGGTLDEINLLYQEGLFKAKNIKDYKYSQAWYPGEETK